ncbi:MAG: IscS subfamily cysteine desulfurase [Acidobacteria bacterium SCN 69-37]|nr:MAG: IscS subfamily cysteine desulfurase [Acidobacteria bacterium SCN 69-37]
MSRAPVYLDCHATTPLDPRVLECMLPYFTEHFGNPASSTHQWGWKAQAAVEQARREVAGLIGASAREIVFTSGATESNNFAIAGAASTADAARRRIVVSAIEHKSVLETAARLGHQGFDVVVVPVDREGRVQLDALADAVDVHTAVVSVMAANNEIGVLQPLADIGRICAAAGAVLHVDAAQAVGKIPIDVGTLGIDLLSLTGHKIHGPKGTGALFVRRRLEIEPLIVGGGHERGLRAGTLNVPGIVGLGAACAFAAAEREADSARIGGLRDRLLEGLRRELDGVIVNGSLVHRLPNNLHVSFAGVDGESLLIGIGDIAVSTGSACSSATGAPSHVLAALMGAGAVPSASVRFGLGRFTTADDVDYAVARFAAVVRHLRQTAPV